MLACIAVHRWPGPPGRRSMVGDPRRGAPGRRGADVGRRRRRRAGRAPGARSSSAMGLGRWKVRWRTVLIAGRGHRRADRARSAWLDLTRDSADRSHLGRLFERIGSDGVERAHHRRRAQAGREPPVRSPRAPGATSSGPLGHRRRRWWRGAAATAWPGRGARPSRRCGCALPGPRSPSPCSATAPTTPASRCPAAMLALAVPGLRLPGLPGRPCAEATARERRPGRLRRSCSVGGVVAALLARAGLGPGAERARRCGGPNYRGHELATAGGIVIVLAVLVVEAAAPRWPSSGWGRS